MENKIKILILEDVLSDLELILIELKEATIRFEYLHVENEEDFRKGLIEFKPDLILSDYRLPQFIGMEALLITKEISPMTPFIIVTGSMNEETAVECIKSGAIDYVLKENLVRLGPAVNQALERKALIEKKNKAEEELRESEEFNKQIISSSNDCIKILDLDGNLLSMNTGGQRLLEINDITIYLNKPWIDFWEGKDREDALETLSKAKKGNAGLFTGYCKTEKGTPKWLEILVSPIKDAQGKVYQILAVSRDITERKLAEKALRDSEENYRIIFEATGTARLIVNEHTTILNANKECERVTGYPTSKLVGKSWTKFVYKEGLQTMLRNSKARIKDLESVPNKYEARLINAKGEIRNTILSVDIIPGSKRSIVSMIDITERKQAEQKLKESEEKFKHLVKNSYDVFVIIDENGKEAYVSESVELITGFSPAETMGHSGFEFLHPDDIDHMSKTLSKLLETPGGTIRDEYRHQRKGGGWVYLEAIGANYLQEPAIKGIVLNVRDITERKKIENELKDSEILYHNLFENSSEFLFTLDIKGNFTDVNKAAENLTKYTKAELLKMNFKDYTPKRDHRKLLITFSNIYKTGKTLHDLPIEAIMKDGSIKYFEISFSLLKKGEQIIGFQSSSKDITEQKRVEEKINLLAHSLRSVNECVSITDTKNIIYFVNDAFFKTYGYTKEELIGKHISILGPKHVKLEIRNEILNKTIDGGWSGEIVNQKKDGTIFPVYLSTSVIKDDKDNLIGLVGVATDITKRKKAEETIKNRVEKLEKFHHLAVGRELSSIKLKQKINELSAKLGLTPPYALAFLDQTGAVSRKKEKNT